MELFQHYIVTRFNLPLFDKLRDGQTANALNVGYLNERLDIFCKYTLQSIKRQTVQNYKWLVLFDNNTPQEIKEKLSVISSEYSLFLPCFLDVNKYPKSLIEQDYYQYIEAYNQYAAKVGQPKYDSITYSEYVQRIVTPIFLREIITKFNVSSQFIVTTRIDNDDMFHPKMIENVQRRIIADQKSLVYNYNNGLQISFPRKMLQLYLFHHNHYTTAVESASDMFRSILYWNHVYVDQCTDYVEIECDPMWIEIIHDSNVSNQLCPERENKLLYNQKKIEDYPMLDGFSVDFIATLKETLSRSRIVNKCRRILRRLSVR